MLTSQHATPTPVLSAAVVDCPDPELIDGQKLEQNFRWQMAELIDRHGPYRSKTWGRLITYALPPEWPPEPFIAGN